MTYRELQMYLEEMSDEQLDKNVVIYDEICDEFKHVISIEFIDDDQRDEFKQTKDEENSNPNSLGINHPILNSGQLIDPNGEI